MIAPRVLVAGIGNIFFGDDGFGVETVRALLGARVPAGVTVKDFGIRGYDLAFALVDGYDAVVFVDATARGQPPGTLCLLELDQPGPAGENDARFDGHSLHPAAVLRLAATLGSPARCLFLVGCEPGVLETENGEIGLSGPVAAAVPRAVEMIQSLFSHFADGRAPEQQPAPADLPDSLDDKPAHPL